MVGNYYYYSAIIALVIIITLIIYSIVLTSGMIEGQNLQQYANVIKNGVQRNYTSTTTTCIDDKPCVTTICINNELCRTVTSNSRSTNTDNLTGNDNDNNNNNYTTVVQPFPQENI
jgi:5-methylthioribose kinase